MPPDDTSRYLAAITDAGAFERLATAILRQSDDQFRSLGHPGVNAEGKTVKSPVDGIAFVSGAVPPHMIAVHHTTCTAKDLANKWLLDPASVKPRGRKKLLSAPAGDIVKTVKLVKEEKKRTPDLRTTLILTTNQEPGQDLVRDVHAAGACAGIEIDIWTRSRLANFLDNEAKGQWLRQQFFGIKQVHLSDELFSQIVTENLRIYAPPGDREAWIDRYLDSDIRQAAGEELIFIIANSGYGKTVACYKHLLENALQGGFSLVLTDDVLADSVSLEQAVEKSLIQLYPTLIVGCGRAALQLLGVDRRLLLAVEDINRSGRSRALIEKLVRWQADQRKQGGSGFWRLLCPVWPQVMASLRDDVRRQIGNRAVVGAMFSADEGAEAVARRRALAGHTVSKLEAGRISEALGHDPLLLALHDPETAPDPSQTLAQFIENALQRLATDGGEYSASEYRRALHHLARGMLLNREMEPIWTIMHEWPILEGQVPALRRLIQQGEIVRLVGLSTNEKLGFRHDRVRELLLARAALDLLNDVPFAHDVVAEPYYAEIFGLALAHDDARSQHIALLEASTPLALFCSLRHFPETEMPMRVAIVSALGKWLRQPFVHTKSNRYLRWEAMSALSEAEGPDILALVDLFDDQSWNAFRARYRNGDIMGGILLCRQIEPGVRVAGHTVFLDHVKTRFGQNLINVLVSLLEQHSLSDYVLIGTIRLAGHIGEPALANALRASWRTHKTAKAHLDEYLWACAQCVDDDPATLLGPVCDAWAALPKKSSTRAISSTREDLASHNIRWAFQECLPVKALHYFIQRAAGPELKWPITYMLHGVDHPDAIEFIVRELAATDEELENSARFSYFSISARNEWERRKEDSGRPMSARSRNRLLELWHDKSTNKYTRNQAFAFWASTCCVEDIELLRKVLRSDALWEKALWHRLRLKDQTAVPDMVAKIKGDDCYHWWQLGRYIWCSELTNALDYSLMQRGAKLHAASPETKCRLDCDSILAELLMRLPVKDSEKLLCKHWHHVCSSHYYVIAALYVATPRLQALAAEAISSSSEPKEVVKHLSMRFGYRLHGHPGIRDNKQIKAIVPYLDLLDEIDIYHFWSACNDYGWYELRRTHLDSRLSSKFRDVVYTDEARATATLDGFVSEKVRWIDHWLDGYMKSGVALDEVMAVIGRWLRENYEFRKLKVACEAVVHAGARRHLEILCIPKADCSPEATALILDTEFALKRRTLSE